VKLCLFQGNRVHGLPKYNLNHVSSWRNDVWIKRSYIRNQWEPSMPQWNHVCTRMMSCLYLKRAITVPEWNYVCTLIGPYLYLKEVILYLKEAMSVPEVSHYCTWMELCLYLNEAMSAPEGAIFVLYTIQAGIYICIWREPCLYLGAMYLPECIHVCTWRSGPCLYPMVVMSGPTVSHVCTWRSYVCTWRYPCL